MYANKNIPEPTCEGWWWGWQAGAWNMRQVFRATSGELRTFIGEESHRIGSCGIWRWTGPIPAPSDAENEPAGVEAAKEGVARCPKCGAADIGSACFDDFDEDKPVPSKFEGLPRAGRGKGRLARIDEHGRVETGFDENESAPSEDEGKKWGKLYEESYIEAWRATTAYGTGSIEPQPQLQLSEARKLAALRFRAECVAPYQQLRDAAGHLTEWCEEQWTSRSGLLAELVREMRKALIATSALSDPAPDELPKPRPSDEELGLEVKRYLVSVHEQVFALDNTEWAALGAAIREFQGEVSKTTVSDEVVAPYRKLIEAVRAVLLAYRGYGDIANDITRGTFKADEDRQAAEVKVHSEVCGAVEQLADAVEDLSTPDELPNPKSVEEPNMCNRTHIGCFSCPWKDATPPKCKGHPHGPTDCKERPDADSFAQPEPPKPTVSDEIRAAATMLLDGVTRAAGEAAERRIRAVLEGK